MTVTLRSLWETGRGLPAPWLGRAVRGQQCARGPPGLAPHAQGLPLSPGGGSHPLSPRTCKPPQVGLRTVPFPAGQILPRKHPEKRGSLTYKVTLRATEPLWAPLASVTLK